MIENFTQGVCDDAPAILMNGHMITIEQILEKLNTGAVNKIDVIRYRKLRSKHWNDGGIAIVEQTDSIKLGHQCISEKRLDETLDADL